MFSLAVGGDAGDGGQVTGRADKGLEEPALCPGVCWVPPSVTLFSACENSGAVSGQHCTGEESGSRDLGVLLVSGGTGAGVGAGAEPEQLAPGRGKA